MNFAVIGAGAWGTAFAIHLNNLGHTVTLVPRRLEQALAIASTRENAEHLPGVKIPHSVQIGHELTPVLMEVETVFLACPSHALRETCQHIQDHRALATKLHFVISLAKGLETKTHLRPTQIIDAILPGTRAGILSGPTNAEEVASGKIAAMVLATSHVCDDVGALQSAISSPTLRIYTSDDTAGVEYAGALKNIYAIAAGISEGLEHGDNVKAALLTRALAEMVRIGKTLGARPETFYGLSGFGDLIATCYGAWSRNHNFGLRIAAGNSPEKILAESHSVIEGYRTTQAFQELCDERKIDVPILTQVHSVLYGHKPIAQTVAELMSRTLKRE